MAFPFDNLGAFLSAIASGAGTAITTVYTLIREIRKRVEILEQKVGSMEAKTGLSHSYTTLLADFRDLKKDFEDSQRRPTHPSINDLTGLVPGGQDPSLQGVFRKLRDIEERVEQLELKMKRTVTGSDFEQADRQRAEDIATVRVTVSEVKGLLQGLQMALGLQKIRR
jgi:hypothetical protein